MTDPTDAIQLGEHVRRLRLPWSDPHRQVKVYDFDEDVQIGPHREHLIVCVSFSTHDSLLAQLRYAKGGNIASHAGGSGNDSTRLPFNEGATALLDSLTVAIATAADEVAVIDPDEPPEVHLLAWHQALLVSGDAKAVARGARRAAGWRQSIEDMFLPWSEREWLTPCPSCGEQFAWDPATGNQRRAVVMQYRIHWDANGAQQIEVGTIRCRFCAELHLEGAAGARTLYESTNRAA